VTLPATLLRAFLACGILSAPVCVNLDSPLSSALPFISNMAPTTLRFKRGKNMTVFLRVEATDSFGTIRARLAPLVGAEAAAIRLAAAAAPDANLAEGALLSDFPALLVDDAIVYVAVGSEAFEHHGV
jgi:hypothetical protein